MKRILTLLPALLLLTAGSMAQTNAILSFTVLPSSPTPQDSVRILAHCRFSSSGCSEHSSMIQHGPTWFNAATVHCPGMATAICYTTDTFVLAPRPVGSYTFSLRLYVCGTPNTQEDEDSVQFTIGSTANVPTVQPTLPVSVAYQNSQLLVDQLPAGFGKYEYRVYNSLGQVLTYATGNGRLRLPIELSSGAYLIVLSDGRQQLTGRFVAP